MNTFIAEFMQYAGLPGIPSDRSGRLSMRLGSGTTITVEPAPQSSHLIVSAFVPAPWKLLEVAIKALRSVHYKESEGKAIAAGIFEDRLVLAMRLPYGHQAPDQIERAALALCNFADQCLKKPDDSMTSQASTAIAG